MLQVFYTRTIPHDNPEVTASRTEDGNVTWAKGSEFPKLEPNSQVLQVTADGDELALIGSTIRNVPICNKFTVWENPFAEFIYTNLLYSLKNQ